MNALARALALVAIMCLSQTNLSHALDILLFIPGIKGESTVPGHADWNNVQSISWGHELPVTTASATGGATVGRAVPDLITFTKVVDSTSPALAFAATSGQPFPQATLVEFVRIVSGQPPTVVARLELTGVMVTKYKGSGLVSASLPTESVSLKYNTVKWIGERIGPDGRPIPKAGGIAGWDFLTNKAQ